MEKGLEGETLNKIYTCVHRVGNSKPLLLPTGSLERGSNSPEKVLGTLCNKLAPTGPSIECIIHYVSVGKQSSRS